jgi:integrase
VFPSQQRKGGTSIISDMSINAVMRRIHAAAVAAGREGWLDPRSKRPAVPLGLRSTFRDWAAERGFEHVLAELALAHHVGSATERAYRRTGLIEARRAMMAARGRGCAVNLSRSTWVQLGAPR